MFGVLASRGRESAGGGGSFVARAFQPEFCSFAALGEGGVPREAAKPRREGAKGLWWWSVFEYEYEYRPRGRT